MAVGEHMFTHTYCPKTLTMAGILRISALDYLADREAPIIQDQIPNNPQTD